MPSYIHMRKGRPEEKEDIMELLNLSFGFTTPESSFQTLLPKLYKDCYRPAQNNIVLLTDGRIRAALGLYYGTLTAGGVKLKAAGIGNVASHPEHRSNGYMRFTMAYALDEAKQNMTDIVFLSGKRQRYGRFGFTWMGTKYSCVFTTENIARLYGRDYRSRYSASLLKENDTRFIEKTLEVYNALPCRMERNINNAYDILNSWRSSVYAVYEGDEPRGWFALSKDGAFVREIGAFDGSEIKDIAACILETSGREEFSYGAAPFDEKLCDYFTANCEHLKISTSEMFNILCYENVIRAFLTLKAGMTRLCDGEMTLLVNGSKLPEQLKITVKDNNVSVEQTDEKPELLLEHMQAQELLGALYSPLRKKLKPECASWFPLPLYVYTLDEV